MEDVMSYYDGLLDNEDDSDESDSIDSGNPEPVDTIASSALTPNPVIADRITQSRQGTQNDEQVPPPPTAAPQASPFSANDLAAMDYAHGAQQDASIGRALNAVAGGFGAKVDNSGYDAMVNNANNTANKVMDRSSKVAQAIANRDLKQQAMTAANDKFNRQQTEKERHDKALEAAVRARVGTSANKTQAQAMQSTRNMIESSRGNQAAQQAEKDLYAASKLKTLFDKYGDLDKLSPQMANLAITEVAKMASGASPDDHMLKNLSPGAFQGQLASLWQKVSDEPTPANAGKFLKEYKDYADSMTNDAKALVTDRYGRIIDAAEDSIGKDNAEKLRDVYLRRFDKGIQTDKVLANKAPDGGLVPSAGAADLPGVGDVVDGYKFKGGDPSKQESWEQVR